MHIKKVCLFIHLYLMFCVCFSLSFFQFFMNGPCQIKILNRFSDEVCTQHVVFWCGGVAQCTFFSVSVCGSLSCCGLHRSRPAVSFVPVRNASSNPHDLYLTLPLSLSLPRSPLFPFLLCHRQLLHLGYSTPWRDFHLVFFYDTAWMCKGFN